MANGFSILTYGVMSGSQTAGLKAVYEGDNATANAQVIVPQNVLRVSKYVNTTSAFPVNITNGSRIDLVTPTADGIVALLSPKTVAEVLTAMG
jgi:hypothetical protein